MSTLLSAILPPLSTANDPAKLAPGVFENCPEMLKITSACTEPLISGRHINASPAITFRICALPSCSRSVKERTQSPAGTSYSVSIFRTRHRTTRRFNGLLAPGQIRGKRSVIFFDILAGRPARRRTSRTSANSCGTRARDRVRRRRQTCRNSKYLLPPAVGSGALSYLATLANRHRWTIRSLP